MTRGEGSDVRPGWSKVLLKLLKDGWIPCSTGVSKFLSMSKNDIQARRYPVHNLDQNTKSLFLKC